MLEKTVNLHRWHRLEQTLNVNITLQIAEYIFSQVLYQICFFVHFKLPCMDGNCKVHKPVNTSGEGCNNWYQKAL